MARLKLTGKNSIPALHYHSHGSPSRSPPMAEGSVMTVIQNENETSSLQSMVSEMTESGCGISLRWAQRKGWIVVPTEDGAHIPEDDIPRIVAAIRGAGFVECFAIATEPLGDLPPCYRLKIEEADFKEFNRALSPFRFLLTDAERNWAISCTEDYLLFAGAQELVQAMLPTQISEAREEFLHYADDLRSENLRRVAVQYAAV